MTKAMPPSTTATSGTRPWTSQSDVDSPIPVVSALTTQKIAVTSGTLENPCRVRGLRNRSITTGGDDRRPQLRPDESDESRRRRSGVRRRQGQPDVGAAPVTIGGMRLAAVGAGNHLHDRQAETTATVSVTGRGAAEALEGSPQEVLRKTTSVVSDVDLHNTVLFTGEEVDRALAVAEGVVDHAADRLVDAQTIGGEDGRNRGGYLDSPPSLLSPPGEPTLDAVEGLHEIEPGEPQRQLAALGLGDRQQILGELGKAVGLLSGRGQRCPQLLRGAPLRQGQLQLRAQDRERGAQLVAGT